MNARYPAPPARLTRGFTLTEVMVSMAILTVLTLLITQLVNSAVTTTTTAEKRISSEGQARVVFDRLGNDVAGLALRRDLNFQVEKQAGNDEFYFFSLATGYAAPGYLTANPAMGSGYSLVGYRVSNGVSNGARNELERLGRAMLWAESSPTPGEMTQLVYLPETIKDAYRAVLDDPFNNSSNLRTGGGTAVPQWDVIGDLVFRLELCYLLADGSVSDVPVAPSGDGVQDRLDAATPPTPADGSAAGFSVGSRWYDLVEGVGYECVNASDGAAAWAFLGWRDVRAVAVAIATLDERSRGIVTPAQLGQLVNALPDFNPADVDSATGKAKLMSVAWQERLNAQVPHSLGLPAQAASGVRAHQMVFYLNQQKFVSRH